MVALHSVPSQPPVAKTGMPTSDNALNWEKLIVESLEEEKEIAPEAAPAKEEEGKVEAGEEGGELEPGMPVSAAPSGGSENPVAKTAMQNASFVRVECPNFECRALGKVPFDRLAGQLRCTTCNTPFYLDPVTSDTVIGTLETAASFPTSLAVEETSARSEETIRKFELSSHGGRERHLGRSGRSGESPLLVFALSSIGWLPGLLFSSDPKTRSVQILEVLARNSPRTVRSLATSESSGVVDDWFTKARPDFWPPALEKAEGEVNVRTIRNSKGTATIDIFIPQPDSKPKPVVPAKKYHLTLFWVKEGSSWWFDANQSLKVPPERTESSFVVTAPVATLKQRPTAKSGLERHTRRSPAGFRVPPVPNDVP